MQAVQEVLNIVKTRDPDQKEFIQAVTEVLTSLVPVLEKNQNTSRFSQLLLNQNVLSFSVFHGLMTRVK